MSKQYDLIVIDGMNMFKTALSTGRGLCSSRGVPTGAVYHGLRVLLSLGDNFTTNNLVFIWDKGPYWRTREYPEYKQNRKRDRTEEEKQEFEIQFINFQSVLAYLGALSITRATYEADDLAYTITRQFLPDDRTCLLWSNDGDWLQLVRDNVDVYAHRTKTLIDLDNFESNTGYSDPDLFLNVKLITGDAGDNVPGVQGVGAITAEKYLNGNLNPRTATHGKIAQFVESEEFQRNRLLIDLSQAPGDPSIDWTIRRQPANLEQFTAMCEDLEFASFVGNEKIMAKWSTLIDRLSNTQFPLE